MQLKEETLSQNYLYHGHVLQMHVDRVRLEDGGESQRECVDHPGGVSVAALTPQDEILLVRQFRYPYREVVVEAPAGKLEPGEDPLEACKRELREETGCTAQTYLSLGLLYPSPGYTNEKLHLYACRVTAQGAQQLDEDEFLEVLRLPLDRALAMVEDGGLPDAKTQALVLRAALLVQQGRL